MTKVCRFIFMEKRFIFFYSKDTVVLINMYTLFHPIVEEVSFVMFLTQPASIV